MKSRRKKGRKSTKNKGRKRAARRRRKQGVRRRRTQTGRCLLVGIPQEVGDHHCHVVTARPLPVARRGFRQDLCRLCWRLAGRLCPASGAFFFFFFLFVRFPSSPLCNFFLFRGEGNNGGRNSATNAVTLSSSTEFHSPSDATTRKWWRWGTSSRLQVCGKALRKSLLMSLCMTASRLKGNLKTWSPSALPRHEEERGRV